MRQILLITTFVLQSWLAQAQWGITPIWRTITSQTPIDNNLDGNTSIVCEHPAGGFVAICALPNPQNRREVYLVRTNLQGTLLSTKTTLLRADKPIQGNAKFSSDAQGNIMIADSYGVAKLTANGDTVWTRYFPQSSAGQMFATQMVTGPDGHCVVVCQKTETGTSTLPDLRAFKFDGSTGQTIWDTSLTPALSAISAVPVTLSWRPMLARRASGYFLFIATTSDNKVILLNENGSASSIRNTAVSGLPFVRSIFSRTNTTFVASDNGNLIKLNDQGNTIGSLYDSDPGIITCLTEDSQNNIIGIKKYVTGSYPGGPTLTFMFLQRVANDMQSQSIREQVSLPVSTDGRSYSICASSIGPYIVSGNFGGFGLAALPAYTPLATATGRVKSENLTLYPNPVASQAVVTLSLPTKTVGEVRIYDLAGRLHGQPYRVANVTAQLPITGLIAGTYVVHLTAADGRIYSRRLVIQ
ncbi:T9SS type A sorting domain-containing protein [Hymenobacter volaticus]|uniref:T9SS type A sorting domain-containing protein n=1 Tax=Hymenobacter volaticus TaxID=2932254 RepID=A0ABY4G537_9BACT|nr:T9SS type A sorting domain-containing protein [Hymenobacter volaticus]UOQ66010.1 T9SS type A sorting domain-containing protein [Hymenobacter volaticus]